MRAGRGLVILPAMSIAAPKSGRTRFTAQVLSNTPLCREHYRLTVRLTEPDVFPSTDPGQFVQTGCSPEIDMAPDGAEIEISPGHYPAWQDPELREPTAFLRRPYSIAGRRDTPAGTEIDLIYRVVGLGTLGLERMQPGQTLTLLGPLGNKFHLTDGKSIGLLVGGGVGLPPMFYLAETLWSEGWTGCAFLGAMAKDLLAATLKGPADEEGLPALCVQEFTRCGMPAVITTDDGSAGLPGRVTDGLRLYLQGLDDDARAIAVIFVCGPDPMMHAVARLAAEFGVEAQACLEQPMACGMATCQSCVVKVRGLRSGEQAHGTLDVGTPWRYRLACTDGPVFNTAEIIW